MRCFVTVGTTEFDELISTLDGGASSVRGALVKLGCTHLTIQLGRGIHVPEQLLMECRSHGIACSHYRFKDTLAEDMLSADLIISHCGAGSILEAMQLQDKLLLLVVNPTLQGNHQTELATAMTSGGYCLSCTPSTVLEQLNAISHKGLKSVKQSLTPYPESDLKAFPKMVDSLFRW